MIEFIKTIALPDWAICPIVNGDYSGLSDKEAELLDDYLQQIVYSEYINIIFDTPLDNYFGVCPITGLYSIMYDVKLYGEKLN